MCACMYECTHAHTYARMLSHMHVCLLDDTTPCVCLYSPQERVQRGSSLSCVFSRPLQVVWAQPVNEKDKRPLWFTGWWVQRCMHKY